MISFLNHNTHTFFYGKISIYFQIRKSSSNWWKYICRELAQIISWRIVSASYHSLVNATAEPFAAFPDNLSEVTSAACETWVVVVIEIDLFIPGYCCPLRLSRG